MTNARQENKLHHEHKPVIDELNKKFGHFRDVPQSIPSAPIPETNLSTLLEQIKALLCKKFEIGKLTFEHVVNDGNIRFKFQNHFATALGKVDDKMNENENAIYFLKTLNYFKTDSLTTLHNGFSFASWMSKISESILIVDVSCLQKIANALNDFHSEQQNRIR